MLATLLLIALAQAPQAPPASAEFPPSDVRIWSLQQAGTTRKEAARRLAVAPDDPETFRALMSLDRVDEALDCLIRIVDRHPERMAEALRGIGSGQYLMSGTRDYSARLKTIVALARERATSLPREQAAEAEYQLLSADAYANPALRGNWRERQQGFLAAYAGTRTALLSEITDVYQPYEERLANLDRIAREHPGTVIAAAALFQKGFQLGHNAPVVGPGVRWDPTERFLETIDIVKRLESGAYPPCEWVTRAPSLIIEFYAYKPQYAPANLDRMLAGYATFVKAHLTIDPVQTPGNSIGYVITDKMAELFKLKGVADGVERTLIDLERESGDPSAARYIRALYAMRQMYAADGGKRETAHQNATSLLSALAEGEGLYARKALATRGTLELEQRNYVKARDTFRNYLQRFPDSSYAWVAAMRVGETSAALGEWEAASAAFESVPRGFASNPVAVVLGHEYAARALEARSQPARALTERAAAFAAWDSDYGLEHSLYTTFRDGSTGRAIVEAPVIRKLDLAIRVDEMRAALAQPGGDIYEYARWLANAKQRDRAVETLQQFLQRFPRSGIAADARQLIHRTRLEQALDLANIERPGADASAARRVLDELAAEPTDRFVIAARLARGAAILTGGDSGRAREETASALKDWLASQPLREPTTDLENDVVAIRQVVFKPLGGGIYDQAHGWNAYTWPGSPSPYWLLESSVPVVFSSGEMKLVQASAAMSAAPTALFVDSSVLPLLDSIVYSLGGTARRQPTQIMETPNQPVGQSMSILQLWNEFFPARPGHWGGWEFTSYPRLTRIEFLDAARTRAAASITVGYSGAKILLEKRDGKWIAMKLTDQWIT